MVHLSHCFFAFLSIRLSDRLFFIVFLYFSVHPFVWLTVHLRIVYFSVHFPVLFVASLPRLIQAELVDSLYMRPATKRDRRTGWQGLWCNKAEYSALDASRRRLRESVTDLRTDRRTDVPTDRWTDGGTDRPTSRDARTHLKTAPSTQKSLNTGSFNSIVGCC